MQNRIIPLKKQLWSTWKVVTQYFLGNFKRKYRFFLLCFPSMGSIPSKKKGVLGNALLLGFEPNNFCPGRSLWHTYWCVFFSGIGNHYKQKLFSTNRTNPFPSCCYRGSLLDGLQNMLGLVSSALLVKMSILHITYNMLCVKNVKIPSKSKTENKLFSLQMYITKITSLLGIYLCKISSFPCFSILSHNIWNLRH